MTHFLQQGLTYSDKDISPNSVFPCGTSIQTHVCWGPNLFKLLQGVTITWETVLKGVPALGRLRTSAVEGAAASSWPARKLTEKSRLRQNVILPGKQSILCHILSELYDFMCTSTDHSHIISQSFLVIFLIFIFLCMRKRCISNKIYLQVREQLLH